MRFWVLLFYVLQGFYVAAQHSPVADSVLQQVEIQEDYKRKVEILEKTIQQLYTTRFDETIELARYGYQLATEHNDQAQMGHFLRFIGLSYGKKGNIDSASAYYYKAHEYLKDGNDSKKLGALYDDMARLYRKLRQPERALEFYEKALALYKKENDLEGIARIYNESGVVYRDEGDYKTANELFHKSLNLQIQRDDSVGIGYALEFIGYNQLLIKDYQEAERYLKQALAVREKLTDDFALMLNYTALGELYLATKQHELSNTYFEKSNALARKIKFVDIQQYNYEQIMANYEALNNFEEAYKSLKRFNALHDSLYNVQKLKDVEEVTTKYETEKKEAQIEHQKLLIVREKKEKYLYVAVLTFGLAALILVIFIIRSTNRHKTQLLLKQQNELALNKVLEAEEAERNRIAKDLHDGIVQEITTIKHQVQTATLSEHPGNLKDIEKALSGMASEIRNMAYQMMPLTLKEFGLEKALETLLERTLMAHHITFDFNAIGIEKRPEDRVETSIYRICQELLNNSVKHSKASHISLLLLQKDHVLTITYEDNGIGFDSQSVTKGMGLNSLQSRIDMIKGKLSLESETGKGTTAYIKIPV
ncbi:MAG TPA: hypothetical protein DCG19_09990 [Cryomorphaceae bacterium]|nr:hypothetical protein [Owenweeksia sp.]MBF98188.1 hypothetical protein [Owenweeksia sp.]HAD97725.1 hypothetical protein [Cryomorphaceae bacterium]HBF21477.1 hypothetical protein [Cryomorphaceae bacterium]HCQ14776.1 hypothetical protein [Cryomorphaceae bacterium]|tara:strand:- start:303 stop:2081 length:1779 start_codon:yes stop_codon:yes gene_type:complete